MVDTRVIGRTYTNHRAAFYHGPSPRLLVSPSSARSRRGSTRSGRREVSTPVLVLDRVERREVGVAEAIGQDGVRLGHPQLDDRDQFHDRSRPPTLTMIGASRQTPSPR